ncbi:hypothetical protein DFH07DRAFT_778786 [Mycena maculata]|uniref:Uncharacterized protein n=1 Tax=Mycena maculata TaxID=230809 RepID=A0AAD7IDD1_9AGAR|nr:hypothetical protein DFH07DRAFT_778786 [Mycena maculata]
MTWVIVKGIEKGEHVALPSISSPATLTKLSSTSTAPTTGLVKQHLRCRKTFRLLTAPIKWLVALLRFASSASPPQRPSLLSMPSLSCCSELSLTLSPDSGSPSSPLTNSDRIPLQARAWCPLPSPSSQTVERTPIEPQARGHVECGGSDDAAASPPLIHPKYYLKQYSLQIMVYSQGPQSSLLHQGGAKTIPQFRCINICSPLRQCLPRDSAVPRMSTVSTNCTTTSPTLQIGHMWTNLVLRYHDIASMSILAPLANSRFLASIEPPLYRNHRRSSDTFPCMSFTRILNLLSEDAMSLAKIRLSRLSRLAQDAKDVKDENNPGRKHYNNLQGKRAGERTEELNRSFKLRGRPALMESFGDPSFVTLNSDEFLGILVTSVIQRKFYKSLFNIFFRISLGLTLTKPNPNQT